MADTKLNTKDFYALAKIYGVSSDPHYLNDLRKSVQQLLSLIETFQEVDVASINPALQFIPKEN